jgi:Fur family iron response transcriptional regulator
MAQPTIESTVSNAPPTRMPASSAKAPSHQYCVAAILRMSGLRPTRQRLELLGILLAGAHRHLSAEDLFLETARTGIKVSLATVYNSLRQFRDVGLVRELPVDGTRSFFDTNTTSHHHFLIENEGRLIDIPDGHIDIRDLPPAPAGMVIAQVDVLVRIRPAR